MIRIRPLLSLILISCLLAAGLTTVPILVQPSVSQAFVPTVDDPTYAPAVLQDSPLLYYRLGEASNATEFADSSGRGIPGLALPKNGGFTPGVVGGLATDPDTATQMSGGNTSTQTSVAAGLPDGNVARSLEWWMKPTGGDLLLSSGTLQFRLNIPSGTFTVANNGNFIAWLYTDPPADGGWHHMVVTYDPAANREVSLYRDGLLVGTVNASADPVGGSGSFRVSTISNNGYNGKLDEIAFYGSELSPEQVLDHFEASGDSRPSDVDELDLVANGEELTAIWNNSTVTASVPDSQTPVTGMKIRLLRNGATVTDRWLSLTATSASFSDLSTGEYMVRVIPINLFGEGGPTPSDAVNLTTSEIGYVDSVLMDSPSLYYRMGEASGLSYSANSAGRNSTNLDLGCGGCARGHSGAFPGSSDKAGSMGGSRASYSTRNSAGLIEGHVGRTFEWWMRGGGGELDFYAGGAGVNVNGGGFVWKSNGNAVASLRLPTTHDGRWHHVAMTYTPSGRVVKVYIDGELAGQATAWGDGNGGGGKYGVNTSLLGDYNGKLDELAFYPSTLGAERIRAHFDASKNSRPSGIDDVVASVNGSTVNVGWDSSGVSSATTDGDPAVVGYKVQVLDTLGLQVQATWVNATATSASISGLAPGIYRVSVQAANHFGLGATATSDTFEISADTTTYSMEVKQDLPQLYYRFGDQVGAPYTADSSGRDQAQFDMACGGCSFGHPGAIANDSDFSGSLGGSNAGYGSRGTAMIPEGHLARSIEWWMRGTGGELEFGDGQFLFNVNGTNYVLKNGGATVAQLTARPTNDNDWHHLVLTYQPTGRIVKLYIDGQLAAQGTASADAPGGGTTFGFRTSRLSSYSGKIDELGYYTTALSEARIQAHFAASGNSRPSGLSDVGASQNGDDVSANWDMSGLTASVPAGMTAVTGLKIAVLDSNDQVVVNQWEAPSAVSTKITGLTTGTYRVKVTPVNGFGYGTEAFSQDFEVTRPTSYMARIKSDSPLLYYRFAESAGAPLSADSSGRETPGIDLECNRCLRGQPGALTSESDKSAHFDGQDANYGHRLPTGLPDGHRSRTFEWWMRGSGGEVVFNLGGLQVRVQGGDIALRNNGTPVASFTGLRALNDLQWHHIALTYEADASRTTKLFIDGQKVGQVNASANAVSSPGTLRITNYPVGPYSGRLDEFAYYGTVLSEQTIAEHFDASGNTRPTVASSVQNCRGN